MTYKNILLGKLRYLILFLVAIQSFLLALIAIFFTGVRYQQSWNTYNQDTTTVAIYFQRLSKEQSQDIYNYLTTQKDLSIWTERFENKTDGNGLNRVYIDIYGNVSGFSDMNFGGKTIVSHQQFSELLSSKDSHLTIGIDKGSHNMLYPLPKLLLTTPIVIDRLDNVFQKTAVVNGVYHVNGLENATQKEAFLSQLSTLSGISVDDLTHAHFGSQSDSSFIPTVLSLAILANAVVLLILFLISILQSFNHFGTLLLLGWGRKDIWLGLFKETFLFSLFSIPVIAILVWLLSGYSSIGFLTLMTIFASTVVSVVLLLLILIIPTVIIYTISPIATLHKRLPMKPLMGIALLFYLLVSGLLIAISYSLDAPMNDFMTNAKIAREWKHVEKVSVISHFVEGKDVGTYSGTSNSLEKSMYHFYQKIANIPGVYLAHGQYFNQQYLDNVHGSYQHVPEKPFWYLSYSDNYLSDIGIRLNRKESLEIHNGTRLYLIPDTLTTEEINRFKSYLQETVTVKSGDIETCFTQKPKFSFKLYHPSKEIFTWSTNISKGTTSKTPIIFVATPENLYFMETANLFVTGYDGFLKIKNDTTLKRIKATLKTDFPDLADNQLQFTTVKNYIDGLQKDLSYTFYLFGSVIVLIIVTLIAIFISLILVYRLLFEEKLSVEYFMGFPLWRRYVGILSLIIGVSIVELLVSILLESRLAIVMTILTLLLQMAFLYFYVLRKEASSILQLFKR